MTDPNDPRHAEHAPRWDDALGRPSRRDVLRWLAYGSFGATAAGGLVACSSSGSRDARGGPTAEASSGSGRRLVVVELNGGNDGLSTLIPFETGRYHDLRPTVGLGGADVVDLGGGWGLNKRLASLHERGVALVTGIGDPTPDLSHFEMLARWAGGLPGGLPLSAGNRYPSGVLGRLCDEVRGDERLTGISLRFGDAGVLRSLAAGTTGLGAITGSGLGGSDPEVERDTLALLRAYDGAAAANAGVDKGIDGMLSITDLLRRLAGPTGRYPDTPFGLQLAFASRLLRTDDGPKVLHVPMAGANFDTHAEHRATQETLMTQLNDGLAAFVDDLRDQHLGDRVLIASSSEFGRRPEEHDGGLDHGTASTMLMLGPVHAGVHGEHCSLTELDDRDNLVATASFDRYYATLAHWMQVDPAKVRLPGASGAAAEPLPGVLVA